jgi:hypothetical protein
LFWKQKQPTVDFFTVLYVLLSFVPFDISVSMLKERPAVLLISELIMHIIKLAEAYIPLIQGLQSRTNGITYSAHFLEPNPAAVSASSTMDLINTWRKTYVVGILERCHIACITSLSRGERWLRGTVSALEEENLLVFSAALRGLLEASADAHDVLSHIPSSLHKFFPYAYLVLTDSRDIDNIQVSVGSLEDLLIHYVYAQKQPKTGPILPLHNNKSNADYISALQKFGVPKLADLYAELCQLTHPAAPSISCFLDDGDKTLSLNFMRDKQLIDDILTRYGQTIELIVQYSFNPACMGLSALYRLMPDWHGPSDHVMSSVGNWNSVLVQLDGFVQSYQSGSMTPQQLYSAVRG